MGVFDTFRSAFGSAPPKITNTGSAFPTISPHLNYFWRNEATGGQDISWSSNDGAWNFDARVTPRHATHRPATIRHSTPLHATPFHVTPFRDHATPKSLDLTPSAGTRWLCQYDQNGVLHWSDGSGRYYTYGSAGWRDYSTRPTSSKNDSQASRKAGRRRFTMRGTYRRILSGSMAPPPRRSTYSLPFRLHLVKLLRLSSQFVRQLRLPRWQLGPRLGTRYRHTKRLRGSTHHRLASGKQLPPRRVSIHFADYPLKPVLLRSKLP